MKILFHDNTLTERGTSVALYDYAKYNEEILKNGQELSFTQSSLNFEELLGKFIFSDKKEKGNDNEKN